jgi:hypothetical protein
VYWSVSAADQVNRADLDGTNVTVLFDASSPPFALDIDLVHEKLYWVQSPSSVYRANSDGSDVESLISIPTVGFAPHVLAVDGANGKFYYAQHIKEDAGRIGRANLDGTGHEIIMVGVDASDIELDVPNGKFYFTYTNPFDGLNEMRRADLDGTNVETLFGFVQFVPNFALDTPDGKIYWLEDAGAFDKVRRANLDGSNSETLITDASEVDLLEIDMVHDKVYYTQFGIDIRRANLDGTGDEPLVSSVAVRGLALDPLHASAGEVPPSILVGKTGAEDIRIGWPASCENSDDDFAVYEGLLGGAFDTHVSRFCSTGGAMDVTFTPSAEDSYYLVVSAVSGLVEGSYGQSSLGDRPPSTFPCLNQSFRACPGCERDADCLPSEVCQDGVCSEAACLLGCNCCSGGNGTGCDCPDCEDVVCAADSFCCDGLWDAICNALAAELCACC